MILDLRKEYNGIYWYPFITFIDSTHVVSEILGLTYEKDFAKANNNTLVCQGKPLECSYYKDCGAD